ncbi:hypothetical protein ScPMuIL_018537 [Solemya velum]
MAAIQVQDRAGVEKNTAALNPSSISYEDTVLPTSPEEATSENKPEVESKKVSAGDKEREKSTEEKKTPKDKPCEHNSQEHSDEQKDSCEDNSKPESEAEVKDTPKADENRKNKTEEAKRKKNEAADRKNYENQVESKVVEPPSEQIEAVTKIQDVTQPLKQEVKDDHKEATSENKPEVESKKVSAGDKEREKSTEEKKTPKDKPCEHNSQEHSDEQKDSCEDNSKPESEAEVKDTPKADENRKNKTEEAKRKKNEAADRKNYENQVESKVVEPPSEQIEAVTKIQDVTQPLKQEVKDDHSGTQLKSLEAKPEEKTEATLAPTVIAPEDNMQTTHAGPRYGTSISVQNEHGEMHHVTPTVALMKG